MRTTHRAPQPAPAPRPTTQTQPEPAPQSAPAPAEAAPAADASAPAPAPVPALADGDVRGFVEGLLAAGQHARTLLDRWADGAPALLPGLDPPPAPAAAWAR
ncbi:hypothetical protein H8N00_31520, partial [Streptomyces sp. AC563]|nr:hypothetical protein [Streptomyces buecherae]